MTTSRLLHLSRSRLWAGVLPLTVVPGLWATPVSGQHAERITEQVSYRNETDGTVLTASLVRPSDEGPHPGAVVLTVAGTDPLVERLVADGYAVLLPIRRGFVDVEPLLEATYPDLARDALAALSYLGSRAEVDEGRLVLVGQSDDAPAAILAAVASRESLPLILLAPPALDGVETFRLQQHAQAERAGAGRAELDSLDLYVERMAAIALEESAPYMREYRLGRLRASSRVELPRNAAFPADETQMHFFASPLWHDRLAFEPEKELARIRSPVLLLIGTEDPDLPLDAYLSAARGGLQASSSMDATVCLLPGRTRHAFTDVGVRAIGAWLGERMGTRRGVNAPAPPPPGCLEDPAP